MRRGIGRAGILLLAACGGGDGGSGPGAAVATVTVQAPNASIAVGAAQQYTATARDAAGATVSAGGPQWSSSAQGVASINSAGVATAVAAGQTTISASVGGKSGSSVLTVTAVSGNATVSMPGLTFSPFTTNIRVTQSVAFDFPALPHNVIFANRNGAPADIPTTNSRQVSRQFNVAGTFPYDCTLHPGMAGTVIVAP